MSNSSQKPRFLLALLSFLALVGAGLSVRLTQHFYEIRNGTAAFHSVCNLGDKANCDLVAASPFAEFAFGLPLSTFAAGWFIALFLLSIAAQNFEWKKESLQFSTLLSLVGLLLGLPYLYIMVFKLGSLCSFCLGVDAVNLLSLGLSLYLNPQNPFKNLQWKGLRNLAGVAAASIIIALVSLTPTQQTADPDTVNSWVSTILSQKPIAIPTSDAVPSFGAKNAPVTIVEFSDFQCPFCRIAAFTLHSVMSRYPGKIRVEFRNFPLDQACNPEMQFTAHPVACEAARVGICAHQEGKFTGVYETLFQDQAFLTPGQIVSRVTSVGLQPERTKACLFSAETSATITKDIEQAKQVGVKSTPTFFFNGLKMEGAYPLPVWEKVIDHLLSNSNTGSGSKP